MAKGKHPLLEDQGYSKKKMTNAELEKYSGNMSDEELAYQYSLRTPEEKQLIKDAEVKKTVQNKGGSSQPANQEVLKKDFLLDTEGGETKWPKKTMPAPEEKEKSPLSGLYGKPLSFNKNRRNQPAAQPSGSGSGNGVSSGPPEEIVAPVSAGSSSPSGVLPTGTIGSLQNTYQTIKANEALPKFTWDDVYKPDSEGYRDLGGYLGDISKTVLGTFGATKPLDIYTPSANFNTMQSESLRRRDLGMDSESASVYENQADRIYNYDVKNIRNMSGGSGGTALANLGGAADRYYESQNQLAVLNEQIKGQNRNDFANAAMAGEQVHRQIFDDKRQIDILNKQSAGALMADSMDNIKHRKEYEDTYSKPGSPYYEYMKELTLDRRRNRSLLDFGQEQMDSKLSQELLDIENQQQEKIERENRAIETTKQEFANAVNAEGMAPVIESAQDFKNYQGQPIVDINSPIATPEDTEAKYMAELRDRETFGLTRDEMSKMTDDQLDEMGIERTVNERGTEQYGITKPMEDPSGVKSDDDPELSNQIDTITREYSSKKKALMDEWYLKDEKKYNKLLKEMEEEEKSKKELLKTEYLKAE